MKKYFIPEKLAYKLEERGKNSFLGDNSLFERNGYIGLFDKNSLKTHYFKNPIYHPKKHGWIAERGNCPSYLKQVCKLI
jgi:hypothetical protein